MPAYERRPSSLLQRYFIVEISHFWKVRQYLFFFFCQFLLLRRHCLRRYGQVVLLIDQYSVWQIAPLPLSRRLVGGVSTPACDPGCEGLSVLFIAVWWPFCLCEYVFLFIDFIPYINISKVPGLLLPTLPSPFFMFIIVAA